MRASPTFNAYTVGINKPIIVIDSGLVELLDDEEEMRFLLGHELGHALSGHAVYQTLLRRLIALTGSCTPSRAERSGSGRSRPR